MQTLDMLSSVRTFTGFAYLDPGTGSYAFQLLLAGMFGGIFAVKQYWQQLRGRFTPLAFGRMNGAAPTEGSK